MKTFRRIINLCMVLFSATLLQSCATEFGNNVSKAVWMTYAHVANVKMFQDGGSQYSSVNDGFWALFDICTLDVQGSALKGFNYDASKFYVDGGTATYGPGNPGTVNASGAAVSSQSPQVLSAAWSAFGLSLPAQYFPKQFYPNLRYRIAVFVKEWPNGYRGEPMTLKYDGQPQVAALVQDKSPEQPAFIPFHNADASPPAISGRCP